ncbi:PilN domain-containing protein [Halioglobus pacificus]|uniref:General secretion pathway protein GspL n=1 Tax=Parahalioglobus pacificus TaxID=930806 RepID=A0A918XMG8_9GAMM|nr:PilN domain-containing protein [Halioglobus pacificus]GHD37929.1 hypothetical protein GCM10007053_27620 [Halioglobus pacificus]
MALDSQQWMLFGYDVRDTGRLWQAAWREFLWSDDSPVRQQLDDVVTLTDGDTKTSYQAGQRIDATTSHLVAVAVPNDLVLERSLELPGAVLPNLESVMALEVSSSSPFSADDTAYGWSRLAGSEDTLNIRLVILSRSAVMTYLAKSHDIHDPGEREVWAQADGHWVMVRGFGEQHRQQSYRRRLIRCGAYVAATALVLLVLLAFNVGFKQFELSRLEAASAELQRDAAPALALRQRLGAVNGTVSEVNRLVSEYPSPHAELARLTALMGDDVFIQQFQMNGREIRLRGRAQDAASVMQLLTEQPEFVSVTAPQAITRISGSSEEQFYLNIQLAGADQK